MTRMFCSLTISEIPRIVYGYERYKVLCAVTSNSDSQLNIMTALIMLEFLMCLIMW